MKQQANEIIPYLPGNVKRKRVQITKYISVVCVSKKKYLDAKSSNIFINIPALFSGKVKIFLSGPLML